MTCKAPARPNSELLFTSQQRCEAPAPPQPEGLREFWPGALLLVGQRPQRVFSLLPPVRLGPPRTRPKFAAALLYEPQTWCTSPHFSRPRENAHGVPTLVGASREGFRPCKLLPKQLATGELLTSLKTCEKFRLEAAG
jgi:hypothetical protein